MKTNNVLNNILSFINNNKDISVILVVLTVLLMMIIPIPTVVMDTIIAFNLGITILVLMVVLYSKSVVQLSTFPNILLILALIRIGITVSTSRLILLNGDAGEIVDTFGKFVVGGNLVVGIIIFTIVTMINFIVITKGSERVAEVAARFSLDAMPGKQMSIDSDLRANNITMEQAQAKRTELGLESKLYGAMDGAMKFVKGDAIASIIDIIINLVGGLIIGMVQHDMPFAKALVTYSTLTVGDGLVQQIPALLISLTAGMLITRVSDSNDDNPTSLGQNLLNQLFRSNKALITAGMALLIFSAIPGMPSMVLIGICIVLSGIGIYKNFNPTAGAAASTKKDLVKDDASEADKLNSETFVPWKLSPLLLNIASNLKGGSYINEIKTSLGTIRNEFLFDIGIEIPQILIRYSDTLAHNTYQVMVFEIPVANSDIYPDKILVLESDTVKLDTLDIEYIDNKTNIGNNFNGYWVAKKFAGECTKLEIKFLTIEEFIGKHLKYVIQNHLASFLGIQETKNILDKMTDFDELIKELFKMLPLNKITEILQRLIAEGISIRNFKVILDAMLEWAQKEKETIIITEYVRKALGRYIAYKFTNGKYILPCLIVDEDLESTIRDSIRFTATGSYIALDNDISNHIIEFVKNIVKEHTTIDVAIAVVTQLDIRRYVRNIIEKDLPNTPVLSFQELENFVEFESLGIIEAEY